MAHHVQLHTEWKQKVDHQLKSTLCYLEELNRLNAEVKEESTVHGIGTSRFSSREAENAKRWWRRYKDFAEFNDWTDINVR